MSSTTDASASPSLAMQAISPFREQLEADDNDFPLLERTWCFWHDKYISGKNKEYQANLTNLCSFSSIPRFWRAYHHLPEVNELELHSTLHMMMSDVEPVWEHDLTKDGGMWTFRVPKDDAQLAWKYVLMAIIGEQLDEPMQDTVLGCSVSVRDHDFVLQVWTADAKKQDNAQMDVIKDILADFSLGTCYYKPCTKPPRKKKTTESSAA